MGMRDQQAFLGEHAHGKAGLRTLFVTLHGPTRAGHLTHAREVGCPEIVTEPVTLLATEMAL